MEKQDRYDVDSSRRTLEDLQRQGSTGFDQNQAAQQAYATTGQFTMHPKFLRRDKRVSHDSKKYPKTTANMLVMDVTASQKENPLYTFQIFPNLMEQLFADNTQTDPAWGLMCFGDFRDPQIANVSLQWGQFELDIMINEWLRRFVMHGGGAGNGSESSEVALWGAAYYVELHNISKRKEDPSRRRGELILITDDKCLTTVDREVIKSLWDTDLLLERNPRTENVIRGLRKNFIPTVLIPLDSENGRDSSIKRHWDELFGDADTEDGIALANPVRYIRDTRELAKVVPALIKEHKELLDTVLPPIA